jgi:hypothetical protein
MPVCITYQVSAAWCERSERHVCCKPLLGGRSEIGNFWVLRSEPRGGIRWSWERTSRRQTHPPVHDLTGHDEERDERAARQGVEARAWTAVQRPHHPTRGRAAAVKWSGPRRPQHDLSSH